jgi:hypothetical protein
MSLADTKPTIGKLISHQEKPCPIEKLRRSVTCREGEDAPCGGVDLIAPPRPPRKSPFGKNAT